MGSATGIDTDPFDLEREVTLLRQGLAGEVEAAAAAVDAAVDAAAGDPDGALDARIIDQLVRLQDPDPLLAWVDVRQLAVLADRLTARLGEDAGDSGRRTGWQLLDLLRRPTLLARLAADDSGAWAARMLALIEASRLTLGPLLRMRTATYGSKPLFISGSPSRPRRHSFRQVLARVETLARGLLATHGADEGPVALLTENRIEAVWADLACLITGIVNVPVPANATAEDVRFILDHCGAGTLIVSGRQLPKVASHRDKLAALKRVIVLDTPARPDPKLMTLERLASSSSRVSPAELERREQAVGVDDLATVMYTSGTTGQPKAIQFSVRNLIFKRFARALALPEIGDRDVLLCYLPLYHTFGRFLEMMAAIFWGATYCFLDNPSVDSMLQGMRQHRPTLFISVPKKWIQLHEAVVARADPEQVEDDEVHAAVEELTGGRLRYGLSAAGHLGSEIFRFFQRYGVELMSGFGMTEATGGITMTPPGAYRDDTLGLPLTGIETRVAEDGELLVRGPYVMLGYADSDEPSFDEQGWFHTGDLMETDSAGYLRLVDRKKEIYKNVKGETIAPQRIENLFRDFESVGRVFLVGDHREYNTALIWPDPDYRAAKLDGLDAQAVKDHYRSVVVSVNKFIAPYERIVDLAIIDRDLSLEKEELTEKGTPRRKTVEQSFASEIGALYQRTNLKLEGIELMLPNWLFQRLGLTAHDIWVRNERIFVWSRDASLRVKAVGESTVRVGSCLYRHQESRIDLGEILTSPRLWLGNEELIDFIGLELRVRERAGQRPAALERLSRVAPPEAPEELAERIAEARRQGLHSIDEVHLAAQAVDSDRETTALEGVKLLSGVLHKDAGSLAEPVRTVLARTETAPLTVRRAALLVLVSGENEARFPTTLRRFLDTSSTFLDDKTRTALVERNIPDSRLSCFVGRLEELAGIEEIADEEIEHATSLIRFLAEYGAAHPTRYRRMRAVLTRRTLFSPHETLREEAARALWSLQEGFRRWLGPTQQIAVDMENGEEYRWNDVVAFDEDVPADDRKRLLDALRTTSLLREAVFLFSRGATVRLSDIPPGGLYLRLLGSRHGKSVYRLTVQTRFQGSYDIAVNLNHELTPQQVREEIQWLILCGEAGGRDPLVENFGGYWHEPDLWSEEFIPGQTVDVMLKRLVRRGDESDRLRNNWPFIAWSALKSYVDFWHRTGHRLEIADPSASSVIVPAHDFLTGARLVSLSARSRFSGLLPMLTSFRTRFVDPVEEQYPELAGVVAWELVFSAVVEIVGEEAGLALFREALADGAKDPVVAPLQDYVAELERRGFVPMRLMFAAQRYRRWVALSEQPTREARARTLQELYDTYGLARLAGRYPETRVRFFRESVFVDAPAGLIEGLDEIIDRQRKRELIGDEMIDAVAELRARLDDDEDLDYFLARLSYPYLRPEDAAGFVEVDQGGRHQSEMVVTREDKEGRAFRIRHALHPKEVGRLHRLFLDANLDVHFRPEHRYLVALNDRGRLIGGIYYEIAAEGDTAHLEKIVVAERYQRLGVAAGLMSELFNRLRASGAATVTTGFFRPEYFYAFGFKIERRYAGLVKNLDEEEAS